MILRITTFFYIVMINSSNFAQIVIPQKIINEVQTALSYYPELKDINLEIKFKKNIKKSTMQARPKISSFFKSRKKREYLILISEKFKISDKEFATIHVPKDVMIGWIGHELGHIMDYQHRSKLDLVWFGLKYLFSAKSIVEAERAADTFAVQQGMEEYILKTKDFILNQAGIDATYKLRIQKFYLSPEEIMEIVNERDSSIRQ